MWRVLRYFVLPFEIIIRAFLSDMPRLLMLLIARLVAGTGHVIATKVPGLAFLTLVICMFLLLWNGRNTVAATWFATTLAVGAGGLFALFAIQYGKAGKVQRSVRDDPYILGMSSLFMCIPAIAGCLVALQPEEEVRYVTYAMTYDSSSGEIVSNNHGEFGATVPFQIKEIFYSGVNALLASGEDETERRKRLFEDILTSLDSYETLLFHQLSVCCHGDWDITIRREPAAETVSFGPRGSASNKKNLWRIEKLRAVLAGNKSLELLNREGGFVLPSGMDIKREDRDGWVNHALVLEDRHCKVTIELAGSSGIPAIREGARSKVVWTRATTLRMTVVYKGVWVGTSETEKRRRWVSNISGLLKSPLGMPLEALFPVGT